MYGAYGLQMNCMWICLRYQGLRDIRLGSFKEHIFPNRLEASSSAPQ
jgi:hypothetical protein